MRARRESLLRVAVLTFALVLAALPASADAPLDQYEAFSDGSDTIRDKYTKLRWQRRPDPTPRSFAEAVKACDVPAPKGGMYRLPTVKELLTLVDEEPHQDYDESAGRNVDVMIDDYAFPKTMVSTTFWSQSMKADSSVWTVNFGTGEMETARVTGDTRFVRCVVYEP